MPLISIVSPCYNEDENISNLIERIKVTCESLKTWDYEIILVDDGSRDNTRDLIKGLASKNDHIKGVLLSRNHGHQLALSAGLSVALGDRVFILDADLQDPPELLPDMMSKMDQGIDVVYGQRKQRAGETVFKKLSAKAFYRVLNLLSDVPIPIDTGDFRLMSRKALTILNSMPERHRFVRGMVSWIGLKQEPLMYDRDARHAGETNYPLRKMMSFAIDAITSFSIRPLKIASVVGVFFAFLAACYLIYTIYISYIGLAVPGWSSIISIVLICSGTQLVLMGLIGEYIGRLYLESKNRPLYVIEDIIS